MSTPVPVPVPVPDQRIRWVTYGGERLSLTEASRRAGLKPDTVSRRLKKGWTEERALGTAPTVPRWTEKELDLVTRFYANNSGSVNLKRLSKLLGRDLSNVCRKARALGLTNGARRRAFQPSLPFGISKLSPDAQHEYRSGRSKAWLSKMGHPRGMLGLKHSAATKARIADKSRERWADPNNALNSDELSQKRSDNLIRRLARGEMRPKYSRCRAGKRPDLGDVYFRSSWEANYARYLNWRKGRGDITGWEYESKTFVFEKIGRGTRAYTPDFRIDLKGGGHEWHEVKGWMDQKSRTRLDRMAKYYPEERVVVIGASWFKDAKRNGVSHSITGWEK